MTTRFIICGGRPHLAPDAGKALVQTAIGDAKHISLDICAFARETERWNDSLEQAKQLWSSYLTSDVQAHFRLVDVDSFGKNLDESSMLWVWGGDNYRLRDLLEKVDFSKAVFRYPIVFGESAGANMLSHRFFSNSYKKIMEGFGILPIKFIPHFGAVDGKNADIDWPQVKKELATHEPVDVEIKALPDGVFEVLSLPSNNKNVSENVVNG